MQPIREDHITQTFKLMFFCQFCNSWSYTFPMTNLMMLSVILLSMLMKLLSTLSVISHLICGDSQNWLLNLNLIYKTLWTRPGKDLLILMQEILNWFHLTSLITHVLLMLEWLVLFLRKNHLFKCWGWFSFPN